MTWWRQLKEAAGAMVTFWLLTLFGLAALSGAVMWFYHTGEDFAALGLITFTSVAGVLFGQVAGFLRLRPWVVWTGVIGLISGGIVIAVYTPPTPLTEYIIVFFVFFPLAFNAGIWTMRARMHLFASWYPVMLSIGAIIVIAEQTGDAAAWFAGRKWAIWSIPTFFILGGTVFLLLSYLVAQQGYGLARWRSEGGAPDRRETRVSGRPRVRLSLTGWAVIVLLSMALTVVTAGVAPYLWRSAPAEDGHPSDGGGGGGDGSVDGHQHGGDQKCPHCGGDTSGGGSGGGGNTGGGGSGGGGNTGGGGSGGGGNTGGGGSGGDCSDGKCPHCGEDLDGGSSGKPELDSEEMSQRAGQALSALLYLLLLLLFFLLLAFIASILFRPVRRAVLLHHFRDPLFAVAPSQQIINLWRSVEVALGDVGHEVAPWEPAPLVAKRAVADLAGRFGPDAAEIRNAAEIYRRAAFGLGVGDEDVARMRAAAACVTEAVRRTLAFDRRFKTWFRRV